MEDLASRNVVVFRVDGNNKIGLGHITRCIALAEMISFNFACKFAMLDADTNIADQIISIGGEVIELDDDYIDTFTGILNGQEIVVLDGYQFNEEYQQCIKKITKLVCIDDLNKQHFYADLVINHSLTADKMMYSVEPYTLLLKGGKYALLRSVFLSDVNCNRPLKKFSKVFVCLGGSDKENLSYSISQLLCAMEEIAQINVVVGSAYLGNIEAIKALDPKISLYQNLNAVNIKRLMQESDFAVVSASGIAYECAAVRIPFIVGYYIDNQILFYQALLNQPNIIGAGKFIEINKSSLQHSIERLWLAYDPEKENFIDGKQQERYLEVFGKLSEN